MLKTLITSKDVEKLTEVHDGIRAAVEFAPGFEEEGGILIDPVLRDDSNGLHTMGISVGPDLGSNVTMAVKLGDMEVTMDTYTEESVEEE